MKDAGGRTGCVNIRSSAPHGQGSIGRQNSRISIQIRQCGHFLPFFPDRKENGGRGRMDRIFKFSIQKMKSISDLFQTKKLEKKKKGAGSNRALSIEPIFKELILEQKFDNWRRFKLANAGRRQKGFPPFTPEQFKKQPTFLKPYTIERICFKTSHLSETDLHYLHSIARDAKSRGRSYGKVFWGSLKINNRQMAP